MESYSRKQLRFNFIVNLLDGGFFGGGIGFASFVTVLPLFVSQMTSSAILIGLIPAIHGMGWQFPQLFTSNFVSRLKRFKPMVLWMTLHERIPFLGLAGIAWFLPVIGYRAGLLFTFILLVWQGLGGGLTATAWQSMIAKIVPADRRGTFYGFQSAAANLLLSGSAVLAGVILDRLPSPLDFTVCFLLACVCLGTSYFFLSQTRELEHEIELDTTHAISFWPRTISILKSDRNFRWFVIVRALSQVAMMASGFYTVYAVRQYSMGPLVAGLMTGVFTIGQTIANPLMGWIGDRWSHAAVMKFGLLAASLSAALAWWAPSLDWFYLVFILCGIGNVAVWTIGMAMTLEFGNASDRPVYIGMANTLIAPSTILAPILGGWLADQAGYQATFILACACGLLTAFILHWMLKDPRQLAISTVEAAPASPK